MNNKVISDMFLCRGCLGSGRMYNINNDQLDQLYTEIIGLPLYHYDNLPQYLCHMCTGLIFKYSAFRKQCLEVRNILLDLQKDNIVISPENVSQYKPKIQFVITETKTHKYPDINEKKIEEVLIQFTCMDDTKIKTEEMTPRDESDFENEHNILEDMVNSNELLKNNDREMQKRLVNEENTANIKDVNSSQSKEILENSKERENNSERSKRFISNDDESNIMELHRNPLYDILEISKGKGKWSRRSIRNDKRKNINSITNTLNEKLDLIKINDKDIKNSKMTRKSNLKNVKERNESLENVDRIDNYRAKSVINNVKIKRALRFDRLEGKYFETKENMTRFESLYDVEIVVLSKEQQMKDVLDRKLSYNYLNGLFKCEECFKGFIHQDNLKKHFKDQHDPSRGDIVCEFCKFRYKDKRGLNHHLQRHRLKFVCRQCKYISRTTFNAKEHFKMHSGRMHECKKCNKSYEKLSTYLTHMRLHHPEELPWCNLCGDSFIGQFGLNGHKKRAHRNLDYPDGCVCLRCGVRFTTKAAYDYHNDLSDDTSCDKSSTCVHCGRLFDYPAGLREHLLKTHRIDRNYQCTMCNKTFARESLFSAHFRRMHSDAEKNRSTAQLLICEVCGKSLPSKCLLVYHQRNHTGERPYKCPDCPKTFTLAKLLRSHSRVHSSDRPFACKYCPKTFKGPSALKGHQNIHTGNSVKIKEKKAT